MKIELSKIRIDGDTQSRVKLNDEWVGELTEKLLEGKVQLPPVKVYFDGKHYWLGDGFHRYHANKKAGIKLVECDSTNGTKRDAKIYSWKANHDHGLPRTNEDRRAIVMEALKDIEYCEKSDREIAEACEVSPMTVGRVRKSMDLDKTAKRITKGGRVIDITKIGRVKKEEPQAIPEDDKLKELATEHKVISEENAKLKDMLAVKTLPASEDAKIEVAATLEDLRKQVASLESQLRAVTSSRNDFQNKNAELIKQVTYWKRRAEKADKQ
jgi:hypothetical protein